MNSPEQDSALILIVDDDKFMRLQLSGAMEQAGYRVAQASNGEEAIAAYNRLKPDLVLLAALMPGMDGFSCCRELQKLPGGDRTPILMIAALEDEESVEQAFEAGATDYITKPIHWALLRQRVRRLLSASQTIKELQKQIKQAQLREEQLRLALEAAHMGSWDWDIASNKITWFNNLEVIFGLSPGSFDGSYQSFITRVHPQDRERVERAVLRAIEEAAEYNIEFRIVQPNGTIRWTANQGQVYYDQTGKPVGMAGICIDISDRKQASRLKQTTMLQRAILESANYTIVATTVDGTILTFNAAAERWLGYAAAEVVGKTPVIFHDWNEIVQRSQQLSQELGIWIEPGFEAFVAKARRGEPDEREWSYIRKDGSRFPVLLSVTRLVDSQGNITGFLGIGSDITERKRTEEKLAESENLLRSIVESEPECVKLLAEDGTLLRMNPAGLAMIEADSPEQVLGKCVYPLVHPQHRLAFKALVESVFQGQSGTLEFEIVGIKGTQRWLETHAVALSNTKNEIVALLGVTRDITQQKSTAEALQKSEERFQIVARATNDAIWDWDLVTNKVWWNEGVQALFGYSTEEVGFDASWWYGNIHPDDRERIVSDIGTAIENGKQFWLGEYRFRRGDGSYTYIFARSYLVYDRSGQPIRMSGGMTDISERKQLEEVLRNTAQGVSAATGDTFFRSLVKYLAQVLEADCAFIGELASEKDEPTVRTIAVYADDEIGENFEYKLTHTPCENVVAQQLWCYPNSVQQQFPRAQLLAEMGVESFIGTSLCDFAGHTLGLLVVLNRRPLKNVKIAEAMLQIFAARASVELERARADKELQHQHQRSQLFADITLKIRQSLQLDQILQTTVTEVQQLLQADRVLLFRLWPNGYGQIVNEAVVPDWPSVLGRGITDDCFGSEYLQRYIQGRIFTIADVEKAPIQPCLVDFLQQFGVKAKLVMPILLKEELWGLLIAHQCSSPRQWSNFEIELLRQIADQIGIALAQAQMLAEETRQREELASYNAELQQFASVASHDLQEPLRKIQAFGNRLKATCDEALSDQGRDYLERMQNAAGRMQTLIEDLLTFSRITTKALPFVSVNLTSVTQEVLLDLELQLARTNGRVEVGELPTIEAEPVQMRQLLQNLISNALKFHPEGEPPVVKLYSQLLTEEQQPVEDTAIAHLCQIIVEDNGIGFDEKYLDRIFNVFQRLHSRSEYEGTGMGLAIVRKIAQRHGGSITAQSTRGQGSKFIVTLPTKQLRGENLE